MTIFGGDLLRLALGFVASVLIARALDPATYGIYVVLGAVVGIAGATADFGLSTAAVKRIAAAGKADPALGHFRARVFFWLRLAAALLVSLPPLLLGAWLAPLLGLPPLAGAVPAAALFALAMLGVPASAASGAVSTILQALGRFRAVAAILVANTALTALLAVLLWLGGRLNIVSALALLGVGASLATLLFARRLLPATWSLAFPTGDAARREAAALIRFGRWLWLANILAVLALQADVLLLNRLGGAASAGASAAAAVGAYGLALNLAAKVDIINRSLYTVLLPAASTLQGRADYLLYIRRGLLRSATICLLLLPAFFLARPFILFFYGPAYAPAVALFRLLLAAVVLDVVAMPLLLLAFPLNRPQWLALVDAVRLAVLLATALLLIPTHGASGAALARVAARALGILPILILLGRRARRG